jgi:hypothetical protein
MDKWESTPRLAFLSPEPASGKTRALEITYTLVPRPVEAINATPAYLFRKVSDPAGLPTILYDELDSLFGPRARGNEEVRAVINAGHRRGAVAGRCVIKGKNVETEELPAFCAVAMAGLGNLPDTILTRSIVIPMRPRAPGERVEPYRRRHHSPEGHALRDRLATWADAIKSALNVNPHMPDGLADRNADVWEALLSVADAAGADWPERARLAALGLLAEKESRASSIGRQLLADLRLVFAQRTAMRTSEILETLRQLDESPWVEWKGKPFDAHRLATLLRPYGVHSRQVWIDGRNQRGYSIETLADAWTRYLAPQPSDEPARPAKPDRNAATIDGWSIGSSRPSGNPEEGVRRPSSNTGQCFSCHGSIFWTSSWGVHLCARCHPPADSQWVHEEEHLLVEEFHNDSDWGPETCVS